MLAKVHSISGQVAIGNIYCPNGVTDRRAFLDNLGVVLSSRGVEFFLGVDFNEILNVGERRGNWM